MNRKILVLSLLAGAGVMVLIVASAVTVFALVAGNTVGGEEVRIDQAVDIAPAEVEAAHPVINVERASYAAQDGDCPFNHSVKSQLTEAPSDTLEQESLAQVDP